MERDDVVKGLRDLAEFLEKHPEAPTPSSLTVDVFVYNDLGSPPAESVLQAVAKTPGGCAKEVTDSFFTIVKSFAGNVDYAVNASRGSVCRRVQVGVKKVKVPDPDVFVPQVEVEQPVYDYECPGSLLGWKENE